MIAGATYTLPVDVRYQLKGTDKVIVTLKNPATGATRQKHYPNDDQTYLMDDGRIGVKLSQRDTADLRGRVLVEAQINLGSGAVAKTITAETYIAETLYTEYVDGAEDDGRNTLDGVVLEIGAPIIQISGTATDSNAVHYIAEEKNDEQRAQARANIGALGSDELTGAVDDALAQAKASGEFDGEKGPKGDPGVGIKSVEQTTTSTEDGGTNVVTVTKTDGTSSTFQVKNGGKGSKGQTGADGHTPVKGTDYFTEEDKQEIAEAAAGMVGIPDKLPNPNALKFTGAVTGSYDGSSPLTVNIPSGGGGSGDIIDVLMDVTIEEAVAAVTVTLDTPRAYKELYIATCVYGDESNRSANAMFLRVNNTDTQGSIGAIAWIPQVENATSAAAKSYGVAFVKLLHDCSFYYCYGSKAANARTPNFAYGEMNTSANRETVISTLKFQSINQWTKFGVGSTIKVYGVRS